MAAGRAADVSFVLDELTGAHPAWPGAGLIDPSRMAMAGHSAGGAAAIAAMLADSRIQVGIDTGAALPGARSLDITRAYLRAFFDQHLRSKPQALLDQPSRRYPEVTFCSPQTKPAQHTSRSSGNAPPGLSMASPGRIPAAFYVASGCAGCRPAEPKGRWVRKPC